jgi:RNA polymerase sigma-70 factor (ECF subfamily)
VIWNRGAAFGVLTTTTDAFGEPLEETEIVRRARGGDGAAWEMIVHLHQEAVFRYAYLMLGDLAEAEDVAQETFVRAFRAFGRFDPSRPLRPWLIQIARNLARNRWRSLKRALRAEERLKDGLRIDAPSGRSEAVDVAHLASDELRRAVMSLREHDRQVIYLRFFLGLSVDETGMALALPIGTVKSRLNRALDRLRVQIRTHHPSLRQVLEE